MKITFVGTSHGVPSADRYCSCYMIESGDKIYMVDAGAPAADSILRANREINDFKALFTTHVHADHTAGAFGLMSLMNWYYKQSSGDFFFTSEAQVKATAAWFAASADPLTDGRVKLKLAVEGEVYKDENIRVEYIPNKHMDNSYSILITEGEKRVLFGGDFSHNLRHADVPKVTEESIDLFVCEMAHITAADVTPYLEKCRAKAVAFTHVFPLDKYNDIEKMKGKYPFEILTPCDGFVLEI